MVYGPLTPEQHRQQLLTGLPMVVPFTEDAVAGAIVAKNPDHIQSQIRQRAIETLMANLRRYDALPADNHQANLVIQEALEAGVRKHQSDQATDGSRIFLWAGLGLVVLVVVLGVTWFLKRR